MIVRAIDENGDWQFGNSRQSYKENLEALRQTIQTRLRSFLGDCFFNQTDGIDWLNLSDRNREEELGLAISTNLLNTEGVNKIVDFSYSLDRNRQFNISFVVETVYGQIQSETEFNII